MSGPRELVELSVAREGLGSDALLAAVLPLFHATAEVHERGLVAPLRGLDRLTVDDHSRLGFAPEYASRPTIAASEIEAREGHRGNAVDVIAHRQQELDLGEDGGRLRSQVTDPVPEAIKAPVLVAGWQSWEHVVGHHDQLTDIFSLGQLLIGLGCGLDFGHAEDVAQLIDARGNFYSLDSGLHPVILSVAAQMAEPDRHHRAQDLRSLIDQLENYRDQPLDFDVTAITTGVADRRTAVLRALRDRLFDLSRRNRLVNFRHTAQTVNLTEVSVPLMLDIRTIRPEQLFTWNNDLAARLVSGSAQSLGKWIRYDEAPYAAAALDKLISTARRDRAEYGQDQLRLVPAFLRWHDLKNDPETRLASPLVLVKVELSKKRGVRDSYTLRITDPVAEVNPTLRHHLHQLYGINLPESVDLAQPGAIAVLHDRLAKEIQASEPGLQLHLREKPRIDLVRQRAMVKLRNYRRRQHGNTANEFGGRHYSYSYRRSDYEPLGVQIFRNQLAVQELPLSIVLGAEPAPRRPEVLETDTYSIETDGGPYSWDVDLCAVALANFNYRTLGLVRDYDELLETERPCPSFEQLFSDRPRPLSSEPPELPVASRHLVVPADGSQVAAVARAQRGESFVIQGPPGTGKSQTITNMIADFVARGQRVLFVCQKRAALDVVHARLASRHLDGLCTLIHDSQADKKSFIHGLRDTYESWLPTSDNTEALSVRRDALLTRVDRLLATVANFEALLDQQASAPGAKTPSSVDGGGAVVLLSTGAPSADSGGTVVRESTGAASADLGGTVVRDSSGAASAGLDGAEPGADSPDLRVVVGRLAELRDSRWGEGLPVLERRLIPSVGDWWAGRAVVERLGQALVTADPSSGGVVARHPLGLLAPEVWMSEAPDTEIPVRAGEVGRRWDAVSAALRAVGVEEEVDHHTLGWVRGVSGLVTTLLPLVERGLGNAIEPRSAAGLKLHEAVERQQELSTAERNVWAAAEGWQEPLSPADSRSALTVAQGKEGGVLSFLSGDWRKVKKLVRSRHDSSGRAVQPSVTELLTNLVAAHDASAATTQYGIETERVWGTKDPASLTKSLQGLRKSPELTAWRKALATAGDEPEHTGATPTRDDNAPSASLTRDDNARSASLTPDDNAPSGPTATHDDNAPSGATPTRDGRDVDEVVARWGEVARAAGAAEGGSWGFLEGWEAGLTLGDVREICAAVGSEQMVPVIRAVAPAMRELIEGSAFVATAVRKLAATPQQLEYAVCAAQWERARVTGARLSSAQLDDVVGELSVVYDELATVNADVVVAGVRRRFLAEVAHSELSVTGMSAEDRARKKTFAAGRRELEHEFGKVMRYKSIRELASGAPGSVVSLLRPVWLMSPSSVSDTLPLDATFDVVIYDEASQIPIEEAIPALHRAPQVIVVGDQMQLPPTQYFRVTTPDPDDTDDDSVGIALTDDSFLAISALRLASTMLTWHYRSRSEALISFSNAAFYQGRLATIPDRLPAVPAPPWIVQAGAPVATEIADGVLAGSITSVRVVDGTYVRRTNPAEAAWIAGLVRELLDRETGKSIGIVAFSEAQQGEIERALDELGEQDPEFGARYEAEQLRTRDDQDAGLFVKNLENVQGDERDIVIMSVCYAAGPDGRMLMNFGPINTSGGEKRLNVIFSRAREHMVIVSSIEPEAITNTYNDGANTLRRFLTYANAVSQANPEATRAALAPYAVSRPSTRSTATQRRSAVIEQLAEALRERGVVVETEVGESVFRCDLALRLPGDEGHRIAVLVDTPDRVAGDTLLERLTTHPRALTTGGWQVHHILTTDWTDSPAALVIRLTDALHRPTD